MCVCVRERERDRQRQTEKKRESEREKRERKKKRKRGGGREREGERETKKRKRERKREREVFLKIITAVSCPFLALLKFVSIMYPCGTIHVISFIINLTWQACDESGRAAARGAIRFTALNAHASRRTTPEHKGRTAAEGFALKP